MKILEKRYREDFVNSLKNDLILYKISIIQKRHDPPGGSMQLVAENGKYRISTVHYEINSTKISETGIFEKKEKGFDYGEPGVVETYKTREEAVLGHFKWCDEYGVPRGNTKIGEK